MISGPSKRRRLGRIRIGQDVSGDQNEILEASAQIDAWLTEFDGHSRRSLRLGYTLDKLNKLVEFKLIAALESLSAVRRDRIGSCPDHRLPNSDEPVTLPWWIVEVITSVYDRHRSALLEKRSTSMARVLGAAARQRGQAPPLKEVDLLLRDKAILDHVDTLRNDGASEADAVRQTATLAGLSEASIRRICCKERKLDRHRRR
jgi:hypothetical protein